jgi:hypothetical protein
MRILQLMLTFVLSMAILSVGSAAVAMSIHSPCAMQQMHAKHVAVMMDQSTMESMNGNHQSKMTGMDCHKVKKSPDGLCTFGQDCVMYKVQLAYPASSPVIAIFLKPQHLAAQQVTLQPHQFIPTPDLFGLWRPPRAL